MAARCYATVLHRALCDFKAQGDACEECRSPIPDGEDIFWIADGYPSPDGTYVCVGCAHVLTGLHPAPAVGEQNTDGGK